MTDPVIVDGALQSTAANVTTPYTLSIGGEQVTPTFAGLAPGFAGVFQFKAGIPTDMPDGDQKVVIQINGLNTLDSDACCFVQVKSAGASGDDSVGPTSVGARLQPRSAVIETYSRTPAPGIQTGYTN